MDGQIIKRIDAIINVALIGLAKKIFGEPCDMIRL